MDTNVLVSGALSHEGPPALIVDAWLRGDFEVVTCPELLRELTDVLARPKIRRRIEAHAAHAYVNLVRRTAILADDPSEVDALTSDPKDDIVIALARAASCDVIVSGDTHLTDLADAQPPVFRPRAFILALEAGP